MKKSIKYLAVLFIGSVIISNNIYADSNLPLTPQEITKLQKLFPASDSVPAFQQQPHEHVVWNQTPIDVTLPVGKERMITFPGSVSFGYDKSVLTDGLLSIQNNNGVLYLTAKKSFPVQRVQVKCNDTGRVILLNLLAQNNVDNTPLDIVIMSSDEGKKTETDITPPETTNDQPAPLDQANMPDSAISYVDLTRFAAQQLYAPKRLLIQPSNIYRVPMHTTKTVALFADGSVIAMPLASWRGGDLYVTAVLVRNQLKQPLTLDPRNICGNWQAAAFFPRNILDVSGQTQDSTTLFLISNRPFADTMQTCLRGF